MRLYLRGSARGCPPVGNYVYEGGDVRLSDSVCVCVCVCRCVWGVSLRAHVGVPEGAGLSRRRHTESGKQNHGAGLRSEPQVREAFPQEKEVRIQSKKSPGFPAVTFAANHGPDTNSTWSVSLAHFSLRK